MRHRRLFRLMAGDIKSPAERYVERMERQDKRSMNELRAMLAFVDRIQRRERNDPDLPPMPLDFQEIEKRRREGKR